MQSKLALVFVCLIHGIGVAQDEGQPPDSKQPRVAWKYAPEGSRFHEILVDGGAVFALDRSGKIHALDAKTGAKRWVVGGKLGLNHGFGLALSPNKEFRALFVGSDTGLVALNPANGKRLWSTAIEKGVDGPAATTKLVVAASASGTAYGCDLKTGKVKWKHEYLADAPEDPKGFAGEQARFGGRPARPGSAVTDGDMVVFPVFDQCRAIALDVETGKRRWAFQTKGWMGARPAIGPLHVVVASQDRHYYGVDKLTGKLAWKVKTHGRGSAGAVATRRFFYFGSCDAYLYAVDMGRVAWKFETEHKKGYGAPIYSTPLVVGDTVYLAAMRGKVYAVDRKTGKLRWKLLPLADSEPISDLVTDGKFLFLATRKDGKKGESAVLAIAPPK